MKKHIFNNKYTVPTLLVLVVFNISCKRLIEIPGNPPTKVREEQLFADSASTMIAVAGVYSYPSSGNNNFTFNNGALPLYTGLSSDELSTTTTDINAAAFYNYGLLPANSYVATLWNAPYAGIYPVNAILKNVAASNTLSASFRKQIIAEMKVLRGLYYFNLVNLFGAVPVVTSTDYNTNTTLPRSSVAAVYDQILKDLTEAQQDLSPGYPSAGRLRPNLYTATAFLAKVHLYQQEWQAAYDAANTVINSKVYSLEPDLNRVFLDGSKEAIWQLPANVPGTTYTIREASSYFIPYNNTTFPGYPLTTWLKNSFEAGDMRWQKWVGTSVANNQNYYYPYKYKNRGTPSPTVEDYMIFRYAEQYLIRAEAAVRLGKLDVAKADIDTIRVRAGLLPATVNPTSAPDLLNAIMKERQTELFCEWGHRWFDLKRTGTADAVLGAEKPGWKSYGVLYPIPNGQRLLNYQLTQNPGYN